MIQTIFLKENEKDIFDSLQKQGIDTTKFEHHFIDLFNKMYNNEVGYYIFKQDNIVYKVIVLPKTINKNSKNAQKDFIDYLLHYHRVNNKYNFDDTKQIQNSLLSLAFEQNNDENNSHDPIEQFEYYKYKAIIESIEKFFKKYKNYKKVNIDYKSQGIKYKLNLAKNIKEIDKTKIHQTQSIDMMYSQIATVTYNALKLFNSKRIKVIKDEILKKELVQSTKKVINLISKKYTIDKIYKLTLSKLNNFKTTKIFSKKSDTKLLFVDIKSLFGFEQMYNDKELSVSNRYDITTTSFFINPSSFYEWYVYDILKVFAGDKYKLLFDKDKDNKTTIEYDLVSKKYKKDNDRSSNPDYILIDEEKKIKIVLDAKWKKIKKLGDIKSSDFLKIKHDASLLENEYNSISYLIYPTYLSNEDQITISKEENQYFNFGILQIDMNFDKEDNNIDFKYDFEQIEKKIDKEKEENEFQKILKDSTNEIANQRTALITKLLNSENLEEKEEVFSELDNDLLKSAENLSDKIEEKISPEVEKILLDYEDILEEDSVKFLKSSSSIYNYYKDRKLDHFDYSMPGSGLWKLVELELNTSFVWYIRIKNGVCDKKSFCKSILDEDIERNIKWVKLNEYDYKKDGITLKSLMLGQIKFLSGNHTVKKYFSNDFISNELFDLLKNIIDLRNEHAHIKAMSLDKFEELYKLLFEESEESTNIKRLLEFKKSIKEYIEK